MSELFYTRKKDIIRYPLLVVQFIQFSSSIPLILLCTLLTFHYFLIFYCNFDEEGKILFGNTTFVQQAAFSGRYYIHFLHDWSEAF